MCGETDETGGFEFMQRDGASAVPVCRPCCNDQNAIFGMEDDIGEELKASDEREEAVKVA